MHLCYRREKKKNSQLWKEVAATVFRHQFHAISWRCDRWLTVMAELRGLYSYTEICFFIIIIIQLFLLHRGTCLFWSWFTYGHCVDMCFPDAYMLNVFLQRKPGMPLGPRRSIWLQHLSLWEHQIQNAAQTINYCTVLDKALSPFIKFLKGKGANQRRKE